jgi:hypothetical protein
MPKKKTADGRVALEHGVARRKFVRSKSGAKVNFEGPARRSKGR